LRKTHEPPLHRILASVLKIGWRMFSCGAWILNRKPSRFNRGGLISFISSPQLKIKALSFHRKPSR
jgi:hypothetical protein